MKIIQFLIFHLIFLVSLRLMYISKNAKIRHLKETVIQKKKLTLDCLI